MKDQERFRHDLDRPVELPMSAYIDYGTEVTERDLEADAASFMAFASAFGIAPPPPPPEDAGSAAAEDVASAPSL